MLLREQRLDQQARRPSANAVSRELPTQDRLEFGRKSTFCFRKAAFHRKRRLDRSEEA